MNCTVSDSTIDSDDNNDHSNNELKYLLFRLVLFQPLFENVF